MYLDLEKNGALMHAEPSNVEKNLKRTKATYQYMEEDDAMAR